MILSERRNQAEHRVGQGGAVTGDIVFQGQKVAARFVDAGSARVVVCFPDRVHPTGFGAPGWGEAFLTARGISAVYVAGNAVDWFQNTEILPAMAACRAYLGADRPVATYGSSMGGYGAILCAATLGATLSLSVSPQYSIDPEAVPFEKRYAENFAQIGPFVHDLGDHVAPDCNYVVAFDPCHRQDMRHYKMLRRLFGMRTLPIHGTGHGALSFVAATPAREVLAQFLAGEASRVDLRAAIRAARLENFRYVRRMGNKVLRSAHPGIYDFRAVAREKGYEKLLRKWARP